MRNAAEAVLTSAVDHPVIAFSLIAFFGMALVVGLMHQLRFSGELSIVAIRFFKHEVNAWRDLFRRLKAELTSWD